MLRRLGRIAAGCLTGFVILSLLLTMLYRVAPPPVTPLMLLRSAEGYGIRLPVVPATRETLVETLRPLVEQPALRRELGAESRAYVEQVHDIDRVAGRLIDLYRSL